MDILGLGPLELLVILVIFLLLFDPAKLPEIARNLGKIVRQLKQMASDLSQTFVDREIPSENKADRDKRQKILPPRNEEKKNQL